METNHIYLWSSRKSINPCTSTEILYKELSTYEEYIADTSTYLVYESPIDVQRDRLLASERECVCVCEVPWISACDEACDECVEIVVEITHTTYRQTEETERETETDWSEESELEISSESCSFQETFYLFFFLYIHPYKSIHRGASVRRSFVHRSLSLSIYLSSIYLSLSLYLPLSSLCLSLSFHMSLSLCLYLTLLCCHLYFLLSSFFASFFFSSFSDLRWKLSSIEVESLDKRQSACLHSSRRFPHSNL